MKSGRTTVRVRMDRLISCVVIVLTLAPVTVLSPLVLESKTVWCAVTVKRCTQETKFPVKKE